MKNKFFYVALLCVAILFTMTHCKNEDGDNVVKTTKSTTDFDGKLTYDWLRLECTIVKETGGFFPPQAARAFGYTGVALYESVAQGWPNPVRLTGQLNGFNESALPKIEAGKEYQWDIVANAALASR